MQRIDQVQTFWILLVVLLLFFYFAFIYDFGSKVEEPKVYVPETLQKFDIENDLQRIDIQPYEIQIYKTQQFEKIQTISMSEKTPEAWIRFENIVGQYITSIEMAENLNLKDKQLEYQQVFKVVESCRNSDIYSELDKRKVNSFYEKQNQFDDKDQRRIKSELELEIFKLETSIKEDNILIKQKINEERDQNALIDAVNFKIKSCKIEENKIEELNQQYNRLISDKEQKKLELQKMIEELRNQDLINQDKIKLYEKDQEYAQRFIKTYNNNKTQIGYNIPSALDQFPSHLSLENKNQYAFEKGQDLDLMIEKSSTQFKEGLFKSNPDRMSYIRDLELQIEQLNRDISDLKEKIKAVSCKMNEYQNQLNLLQGDLAKIIQEKERKQNDIVYNRQKLQELQVKVSLIKDFQLQEIDNSKQIQSSYEIFSFYKENRYKDDQCLAACLKLSQLSEQMKAFKSIQVENLNNRLLEIKSELSDLQNNL
ncbi:hypothetical protein pb186bvf_017857 [Paramecium bursaria]